MESELYIVAALLTVAVIFTIYIAYDLKQKRNGRSQSRLNSAAPYSPAPASSDDSQTDPQRAEGVAARLRQMYQWWNVPVPPVGAKKSKGTPAELVVVLGQLVRLALPDRGLLFFAFLFLSLAAISELGIPYCISTALVASAQGEAGKETFRQSINYLLAATLSYGLFSGIRGWIFSITNQRMVRRLREGVYRVLIEQEIGWLDQQ
eukprot:gene20964-25155_t